MPEISINVANLNNPCDTYHTLQFLEKTAEVDHLHPQTPDRIAKWYSLKIRHISFL